MIYVGLKLHGWKRYRDALGPFTSNDRQIMTRHLMMAGAFMTKQIRSELRNGRTTRNAALTAAIKNSTKPLVDTGLLYQSATHVERQWNRIAVGVARFENGINIAEAVHEGVSIHITPRMRNMFSLVHNAITGHTDPGKLQGRARWLYDAAVKHGIDVYPIGQSKQVIRLPARPFLRHVFESPINAKIVQRYMQRGVNEIFTHRARK